MTTVDEALQEIKDILGKGLYPTAEEPVRKVLLKLRGKKSTARLYVIVSLIWLVGWIVGIVSLAIFRHPETFIILAIALIASLGASGALMWHLVTGED